ncbi:MAG: hypothetical protein EPO02_00345 [Nitrospirae bacterium]|nr:MAG: hypothetical protein EPO02_00345 [Nitrospirota bacterium]
MGESMRRGWKTVLAAVLQIVVFAWPGVSSVNAKETFKDEAGRVIYSIDDDGIVSMFENSPTDLTVSVTRGTREQMQPQITEIGPDSVPAGAPALLRLKGKNLIGAAVKLSVREIEVGAHSAKPKSLDVPIRVPPDVRPGEVTIEVSTPIGSTKATIKIKDMQIGGTGGARPDVAGVAKIAPTAPASCPAGMVGVTAERGGFCIEVDRTFKGDFRVAEKACAAGGRRLCQASEWQAACEQAGAGKLQLKNVAGDWEWTGSWDPYQFDPDMQAMDFTPDIRSILLGRSDCQEKKISPRWKKDQFPGRCCK